MLRDNFSSLFIAMIFRSHAPFCVVLLLGGLLFVSAGSSVAQPPDEAQTEAVSTDPADPLHIKQRTSTFQYRIEGRPDPFLPFLTERSTRNEDPNEIVEENQVLTGMQLFEPSQLTLVALMATGTDRFAMVQDFTGKGYIIKVGTKIGRRGEVVEITPNRVLIEETARTRGGQTLTNKIAMVLKKEGEE